MTLASKIAKVQLAAEVSRLPKRTVNVSISSGGSYKYDYIEESTLMEKIRPLLASEGVAVFYSDEIKDITGNLARVRVTLTLVDGESGEQFEMFAEGVGTDKGDKHVNKAKTAAMRYLLWKWFLVPSDIDPETENVERSDKPPRAQIKFAKDEAAEEFLKAVAAAGFDTSPTQKLIDEERLEYGGIREDWLTKQRQSLERAIATAQQTPSAS